MGWVSRFAASSIGAKAVMAVTGVLLVGFVVAHMLGHLIMFSGADAYNTYAKGLQDLGALLWIARLGLLFAFLLHVISGIRLAALNKAARPVGYQASRRYRLAGWGGRTMAYSGVVLLVFIVYHLMHFTWGVTHPEYFVLDPFGRPDVYFRMVKAFQDPVMTAGYAVAMVLLGLHLSHGISSFFQSIGLNSPKYFFAIEALGPAVSTAVVIGYLSVPAAILAGRINL